MIALILAILMGALAFWVGGVIWRGNTIKIGPEEVAIPEISEQEATEATIRYLTSIASPWYCRACPRCSGDVWFFSSDLTSSEFLKSPHSGRHVHGVCEQCRTVWESDEALLEASGRIVQDDFVYMVETAIEDLLEEDPILTLAQRAKHVEVSAREQRRIFVRKLLSHPDLWGCPNKTVQQVCREYMGMGVTPKTIASVRAEMDKKSGPDHGEG
jgi:hypothetical protein